MSERERKQKYLEDREANAKKELTYETGKYTKVYKQRWTGKYKSNGYRQMETIKDSKGYPKVFIEKETKPIDYYVWKAERTNKPIKYPQGEDAIPKYYKTNPEKTFMQKYNRKGEPIGKNQPYIRQFGKHKLREMDDNRLEKFIPGQSHRNRTYFQEIRQLKRLRKEAGRQFVSWKYRGEKGRWRYRAGYKQKYKPNAPEWIWRYDN